MNIITLPLESEEKSRLFGVFLGHQTLEGDVICLDGELGAGKTTLTQAIASGAGMAEGYHVSSPSYAILHEYPGKIPIYHMDFYRLGSSEEVVDMGLDEYFYTSGLTIIEWADRANDILPEERLSIRLCRQGISARTAAITLPDAWQKRMDAVLRALQGH